MEAFIEVQKKRFLINKQVRKKLDVEFAPIGLHLVSLMYPFELAELGIERALLKRAQLERESRAELLQAHLLSVAEYVAMVAHEYEIALIVKRDAVATFVLRIVREKRGERASDLQAQPRVEVV